MRGEQKARDTHQNRKVFRIHVVRLGRLEGGTEKKNERQKDCVRRASQAQIPSNSKNDHKFLRIHSNSQIHHKFGAIGRYSSQIRRYNLRITNPFEFTRIHSNSLEFTRMNSLFHVDRLEDERMRGEQILFSASWDASHDVYVHIQTPNPPIIFTCFMSIA